VEAYSVVRCYGSNIVLTFGSQMAARLSTLRTSRTVILRNIIFLLMVLITLRG
jgi:hypothetical protein